MLEKIKMIYFVFSKPRPVTGGKCGGGKTGEKFVNSQN